MVINVLWFGLQFVIVVLQVILTKFLVLKTISPQSVTLNIYIQTWIVCVFEKELVRPWPDTTTYHSMLLREDT